MSILVSRLDSDIRSSLCCPQVVFLPEAADFITGDAHECYLLSAPISSHRFTVSPDLTPERLLCPHLLIRITLIHRLPSLDRLAEAREGACRYDLRRHP